MMGVEELIQRVQREERLAFTEAESKALLKSYGIPVVEEIVVTDEESAVSECQGLGFPVVLKGLGARLTHKTERGLVKVNIKSVEETRQAYRQIKESAGEDWEGCLIQPLVSGKREFVAGLFRDAQFGPCVMFGLGGIFTEALADVSFRIAPLNAVQARSMLDEIKARKLLGQFRGEAAADHDQLLQVLMGLSRLGMEHPEIKEVDINPLIVSPDGQVKAVDALVILDEKGAGDSEDNPTEEEMESHTRDMRAAIDVMVHAKSVAVIGATPYKDRRFSGMYGSMVNFGYPGRLYPVNPNIQDIDGVKAYPNLTSLPEKVDLVIVSIPAKFVPDTLRECVATGNKNIHIFSSGFKETGEEEGTRMQAEMEKIAREGGLRVVGPNCMGFYVPGSRMVTWQQPPEKVGPVSFISQSGGNAQDFTNYTTSEYGIYFNKTVSYGNALTVDSTDFLDYLGQDEETKIITMYMEGVKDGRRLLNQVTDISRRKPIIIYKGGLTESGARAVSSHTGSMAGGEKIWKAFFRQSGAVGVDSLEEMADVTLAFNHLGTTPGKRTTVLGIGGGIGVAVADSCGRAGLDLPALSPELIQNLRKVIPPAGTMIRNPIDAVIAFLDLPVMGEVLEMVAESGEIDNFIISVPLDWLYNNKPGGTYIETVASYFANEARKYTHGKPLVVVWRQYLPSPEYQKWIPILIKILMSAGIPVYEGLPRAVFALAKLAEYQAFRRDNP